MAATPYSKLLAAVAAGDGVANLDVPDDWLQGRTLFGGLQVAIALAAMRTVAPAAPLRTLQATFLSPVPGGPVLTTHVTRRRCPRGLGPARARRGRPAPC